MRAVDTNVIVRVLTNDHPEQARRARHAMEGGDVFVPLTVMLESAWVLRRLYDFTGVRVAAGLREVVGLPGVHVEEPERASTALDWAAAGMDLADAFHLAGALACTAFVSFDRALAKTAARLSALPVVEP